MAARQTHQGALQQGHLRERAGHGRGISFECRWHKAHQCWTTEKQGPQAGCSAASPPGCCQHASRFHISPRLLCATLSRLPAVGLMHPSGAAAAGLGTLLPACVTAYWSLTTPLQPSGYGLEEVIDSLLQLTRVHHACHALTITGVVGMPAGAHRHLGGAASAGTR